ncbi:MAG: hypothetical protein AB8G18_06565 [Gammaproteobacteria bacterium]
MSVFGEERFQFGRTGLTGITHAYGVDYRPGGWTFNFSGENGEVDTFERNAVSASLGYGGERFQWGGQLEFRKDEAINSNDERNTRLYRLTAKYQANDEWRFQAKYNRAFSDQTNSSIGPVDFREAEFTEASLSAAYRPIWDDRLNILTKLVYLEDLSPTSQRFDGEVLNYRQRSQFGSIDVSYDLFKRWTIGGKYAYRQGEVTSNRESLDFTQSQADLSVVRLDYHLTHRWDALIEGRYLSIGDGIISRKGGLFGVYRHVNDQFKLGGGFAWGGIEERYLGVREDENLQWYMNLIGKF